jgi:methionyl-tRNA formyltransferase
MKRIIFMGTPVFAVPVLEGLINSDYEVIAVVSQPDKKVGRKQVLTPTPVKELALKYNIPVIQPKKIREEFQEIIDLNADLIITCAYGQIVPNEILDAPQFGCINVHGSLLPKLRGGAPIHKSITYGYEETGVTIMYMAEKMDAGDMLFKSVIPIEEVDTVGTLHDKMQILGRDLLLESLPKIFAGDITPIKQNEDEVTYAWNIKKEEEKIDWSKDHVTIYNHIRGFNPWPGTYTELEGKRVKCWLSKKSTQTSNENYGTIIDVKDDSISVVCGDGVVLELTEVQFAGKKRMLVSDYVRGINKDTLVNKKFL